MMYSLRQHGGDAVAKATKTRKTKKRKLTTNEALEQLLGKKASKRLRKLAKQVAAADTRGKRKHR